MSRSVADRIHYRFVANAIADVEIVVPVAAKVVPAGDGKIPNRYRYRISVFLYSVFVMPVLDKASIPVCNCMLHNPRHETLQCGELVLLCFVVLEAAARSAHVAFFCIYRGFRSPRQAPGQFPLRTRLSTEKNHLDIYFSAKLSIQPLIPGILGSITVKIKQNVGRRQFHLLTDGDDGIFRMVYLD